LETSVKCPVAGALAAREGATDPDGAYDVLRNVRERRLRAAVCWQRRIQIFRRDDVIHRAAARGEKARKQEPSHAQIMATRTPIRPGAARVTYRT